MEPLRIVGNLKVSKAKWVETFTYLLNVDPTSALPTRRIARLLGWCADRAKRFRERLPEAQEINDSMKLQASHHSNSLLHDKSDLKGFANPLEVNSTFIALESIGMWNPVQPCRLHSRVLKNSTS